MKKILYSIMALAIAAITFTACEDVPQPYPTPDPTNNGTNTEVEGATGDGSLENPFNSIAATNEAKKLSSGGVSEQYYYIKGKVVSIATDKNDNVLNFDQGTFGNASFYISDDGTTSNQFYCYRVLYLGNKKWTNGAGDILKVGDEVIVCARLTMYNTTPETQQNEGYLYSLNGKTEGGGSQETGVATGDGTLENPFNAVAATNEAKKLSSGAVSDKAYYIKGKVASIATDKNGNVLNFDQGTFGNATFYISDDGTEANQFYCYRVLYLGNKKWTNGAGDILKVGDEVIVCAKLTMYNTTPETQQNEGYLYSLNGNTESGGETPEPTPTPEPSGDNLLSNGDFETWSGGQPTGWKSNTTASSATLSQSSDAHGGSYAVKVTHDVGSNKRIAYQEITLKAGTYTMAFYVKASSSAGCSVRPGYTDVVDGKANSSYTYGDYVNDITTEWQLVTHSFTLGSQTTVNILIMVPKNSGSDPIIDDFSLTTTDGGLATTDNPDTPETPGASDAPVTATVAEFIAAAESTDVWYQLTGTITHLEDGTYKNSTTYGNFDLVDATGSVYVYGVLSEKGGAKAKFADLMNEKGIKDGSKITIIGNRGSYNGKIEVTNAYFVSVTN